MARKELVNALDHGMRPLGPRDPKAFPELRAPGQARRVERQAIGTRPGRWLIYSAEAHTVRLVQDSLR